MTHKERVLCALKGTETDRLAWVPRIDLWYQGNVYTNTLPGRLQGLGMEEILDGMDAGHNLMIPDYTVHKTAEGNADRGLGMFNCKGIPYRVEFENTQRIVTREDEDMVTEYKTPCGSVRTKTRFSTDMRRAGATVDVVMEHAFKGEEDYAVLEYLFRNAKVIPDYESFREVYEGTGDRGVVALFANPAASPVHMMLRDLMPATDFYMELMENRERVDALEQSMQPFFDSIVDVVAECPYGEVVFCGANFDESLTYPPFFEEHILPYMQKYGERIRAGGKYLSMHCDGENEGLLPLLAQSGADMIEAVCPKPMTKCSISDIRAGVGPDITIFGGVASNALLQSSMGEAEFDAYMADLLQEVAGDKRFILGIADTTPKDADFSRIEKISQLVGKKGKA
ncbi:hypothetical protein LJC56_00935 [Christensenellaceae bacterium OttesenSCG-928-K19]|nr:hypothetical protein [Christensenellaceae bacterium OttesenSCG-928-K19]